MTSHLGLIAPISQYKNSSGTRLIERSKKKLGSTNRSMHLLYTAVVSSRWCHMRGRSGVQSLTRQRQQWDRSSCRSTASVSATPLRCCRQYRPFAAKNPYSTVNNVRFGSQWHHLHFHNPYIEVSTSFSSVRNRAFASGPPNRNNDTKTSVQNFDRRLLQPAQRGELVGKHTSMIPRLAARQGNKPHLSPDATTSRRKGVLDFVEEAELFGGSNNSGSGPPNRAAVFDVLGSYDATSSSSSTYNPVGDEEEEGDGMSVEEYISAFSHVLEHDPVYYWREADYDPRSDGDGISVPKLQPAVAIAANDADAAISEEAEDEMTESSDAALTAASLDDDDDEDEEKDGDSVKSLRGGDKDMVATAGTGKETPAALVATDDYAEWFRSQHDILEFDKNPMLVEGKEPPEPEEELVDLHIFENPHPDSTREPKPFVPRNRARPDAAFVERYSRFLYVMGLPSLEVNGVPADLKHPVDRMLLQKAMAHAFSNVGGGDDGESGVSLDQCCPASSNSGYIGFDSPIALAHALAVGPVTDNPALVSPPVLQPFSEKEHDFYKVSPDATLLLDNLERGYTSVSLARLLFPSDTEVGDAYGNITAEDIHFLTKSSALVRFSSKEQAESLLDSHLVRTRMEELGRYTIRMVRGRRNLVHSKLHHGKERRKLGPHLLVDGDMPTRPFYISHAGVLLIGNLDVEVTKAELTALFQPFCAAQRDMEGSIEFVTCQEDYKMGQAYIGFDLPGEAETAAAALGTKRKIGDRSAFVSLVQDRRIPNKVYVGPERRPDRHIDELLRDLNDWEQFVDPADIVFLEASGVSKHILNDALRGIRYNNATFGALDYSIRAEALEPHLAAGQQYKELVQLYVQTLKECLVTPENPGAMFTALHLPDEEIDVSVFEKELVRQEAIKRERGIV